MYAICTQTLLNLLVVTVALRTYIYYYYVYAAEISPTKHRGFFCSFFQLFLAIGLIFVYFLGSFPTFHYHNMCLLILIGILSGYVFVAVFICETPRWLIAHNDTSRARSALELLKGKQSDVETELKLMEDAQFRSQLKMSRILETTLFQTSHDLYGSVVFQSKWRT